MSSDVNGSAGSRPARVVRSATEWAAIMEDFERSGMSRRSFCESCQWLSKSAQSRRRSPTSR